MVEHPRDENETARNDGARSWSSRFVDTDDDIQFDPATDPANQELIAELKAAGAWPTEGDERSGVMTETGSTDPRALIAAAVRDAVAGIEGSVLLRDGKYALEEDLRGGLVSALLDRDQLVLTEAKARVPGWTRKLGGFDFAVVGTDGTLALGETKWADGNLYESMWDILELASASTMPRISAAAAVYAAPTEHWATRAGADLFADRDLTSGALIAAHAKEWQKNLAGSAAEPIELPRDLQLRLLAAESTEVLGRSWQVRAVAVTGSGPPVPVSGCQAQETARRRRPAG